MINIQDVPDDLIIYIFSFLSLQDRKSTRLVCGHWLALSYESSLVKEDVIVIKNYLDLDQGTTPYCRHPNVKVCLDLTEQDGVALDKVRAVRFWLDHGAYVKSLQVTCSCFCLQVLLDIFDNCPNLRHLSLSTDDEERFEPKMDLMRFGSVSFPDLLSVDLKGIPDLMVPILMSLKTDTLHLEKIVVVCYSINIESFKNALFDVIQNHSFSIKEINLNYNYIDDCFVERIAERLGSQFSRFSIHGCNQLTNSSLRLVADHLMNVEHLFLGDCTFSEIGFDSAFLSLKHLSVVSLLNSCNITDTQVATLTNVSNLSRLDLSFCRNLTNEGIYQIFGYHAKPLMYELRMASIRAITDDLISKIARNLPNLRVLNLNDCPHITNRSFSYITCSNLSLRCLIIPCSKKSKVACSISNLTQLVHLSANITKESIIGMELAHVEIAFLSNVSLNKVETLKVLDRCPSLKHLDCNYYNEAEEIKLILAKRKKESLRKCDVSPFGRCLLQSEYVPESLF